MQRKPSGELIILLFWFYILFSLYICICGLILFFFQDLQSDFADYVRKRRLRRLELQGRNNTFIVQCKLLLRNTPKKSSKIGKGWKDFCTFNRLEEGDILVFLADKKMKKKKIKVYVHKECNF